MQITRIQNIVKNNYQYNNSINFNATIKLNSATEDSFEGTKPSIRYYNYQCEFNPKDITEKRGRLFIKSYGETIPYNAKVEKSDGKGNVTRTTYNNGYKFCVKSYKNSALTQEDFYEDVFGSRHSKPHKRTSVRKYSSTDESKAQQYVSFQISRNHDECWNKNPQIEMYKKEGDSLLRVNFHVPSKGKTGAIYATKKENEKETRGTIFLYQDGTRHNFSNNNNALILNSLLELRETIQSAEFKADFGFNNKFNSELDKAIDSLLV